MATSVPAEVTIEWPRGTDGTIRGTLGSSVAGQTHAFYIAAVGSDTALVTKTTGSGLTVITEATGVMDVTISAANTDTELDVSATGYRWSWWRTDSGNVRLVGHGPWISTRGKPA